MPTPQEWCHGEPLAELHLPHPNPFLPTDFQLLPATAPRPSVLLDSGMVRLWHRADPSFRLPKAVAYIHLHLPESYLSPEAAVQTQLLSKLVNDALRWVRWVLTGGGGKGVRVCVCECAGRTRGFFKLPASRVGHGR